MRTELEKHANKLAFVAINRTDALDDQAALVARCKFDLIQDNDKVGAFKSMDAVKDDIYIYDQAGKLAIHLPFGGEINTNLGDEGGYANVKGIALALANSK